ncbi:MAG: hypothetical protein KBD53_00590 [Candidatus Omnitrophica bacterium]|nr:hypothetical protein [Candidatus Omnitrophota bacterium]
MVKLKTSNTDQFEIEFCEGLLKKIPHFFEAMVLLGDLYTKVGRYQDGLAIDEKLYQIDPENPVILYNLACSYSLMNHIDLSFRSLKKAITCGYDDYRHIEHDLDLENLKKDKRFQKYFAALNKKRTTFFSDHA